MNKVLFSIEGQEINTVVNQSKMSDEFVNRLIRTFIDLGWIITEVKTEGWFEMKDEDTVHLEYNLQEIDGNVQSYDLDEDTFVHLMTDDEPTKKIGFVGMSNVSRG